MNISDLPNAAAIAEYVGGSAKRDLPEEVLNAARMCLVDWVAVALGGRDDSGALAVWRASMSWGSRGKAVTLLGGWAAAPVAALVNGTLAHVLDFDDTHNEAATHFSAPLWAAVLALGAETNAPESAMLKAFVTGFEVGSRVGSGFGGPVTERGWHATGVFGRLAAAAASAELLGLNAEQTSSALGAAATQASGLTGSFASMSKPFHAGKAAMDGILSAQLAAGGFRAADGLLEEGGSLATSLVQDRNAGIRRVDFTNGWEILKNTFKPYAACMLTHASIDAARQLAGAIQGRRIAKVSAGVNPLAVQIAARPNPRTPTEAKFSVGFGIALALTGRSAAAGDFSDATLSDPSVREILRCVELTPMADLGRTSARMSITLVDGEEVMVEVPVARGNPANPMSWEDLERKFKGLVEPVLGTDAGKLFALLTTFGTGRRLEELQALLQSGIALHGKSCVSPSAIS